MYLRSTVRCSVVKMAVDSYRTTLSAMMQALQSGENVVQVLQNLNILLEATSSGEDGLEIASHLSVQVLFNCLSSADEEQIKACCSVLAKIFSKMPATGICQYEQNIELGLQHTSEDVRKMTLQMLRKNSSSEQLQAVILAPTMFHLVTQVLGDSSLECATLAAEILLQVVRNLQVLDVKIRHALWIDLEGLMTKSDIVRYRVYELVVKVALGGGEAFESVQSSGLLHSLVKELDLDDVLVKMNCIELLVMLMESNEGLQFLESAQVVRKLHTQLLSAQQDPLGSLIIPGLVKFFGHLSCSEGVDTAAICSQYPEFLQMILAAVDFPQDDTLWGVAVDTVGALGSTLGGRKALELHDSQTKAALKTLGGYILDSSPELRIRALCAIAMLLSCKEENDSWEASKSREWFNILHPNILPTLISILKQPFKDLRTAGLKVLLSMAPWQWAQKEMCSQAGFLEYLLDRRTEPDKVGKELKYEVVHTIVVSGTAESVFGGVNYLKLRQYDREGPFFYTVETTVALEGST